MIAYVQDTGLKFESIVDTSSQNFASLPTVGNHVFTLAAKWNNPGSHAVSSDNQGNTWTDDVYAPPNGILVNSACINSAKVTTSAGTFTVSVNNDPLANAYWTWLAVEFSGLKSTGHLDQTGTANAAVGLTGMTVTAGGANTQANALVLAVLSNASADTTCNMSDPPSTGFTSIRTDQDGQNHIGHQSARKVVSSIETSACTWTYDSTTVEGTSAALATYKDATAGGGGGGGARNLFYRRRR